MTARTGPLTNLRVLDLGTIFAGPMIGAHLGDLGAEVIKIEPPRGDDVRRLGTVKGGVGPWWKAISRNKQLVAIDPNKPEGARILERLARDADIVAAWIIQHTQEEALRILRGCKAATGPINNIKWFFQDPQVIARASIAAP